MLKNKELFYIKYQLRFTIVSIFGIFGLLSLFSSRSVKHTNSTYLNTQSNRGAAL